MAADSVMLALYHSQCLKDRLNSMYHHRPWSKCSSFPEVGAGNPAHFRHISREEEHRTTSKSALQTISSQFCFAANINLHELQRKELIPPAEIRATCAAVSSSVNICNNLTNDIIIPS